MNKTIKKILIYFGYILLYIMLFISLLFTSLQVVVYNDAYFQWHYEQHNVEASTGMTIESLMEVTDKMMDYLIDHRDSLDMVAIINGQEEEVFGDREKAHMVDVKDLFMAGKRMRDISAILLLIAIIGLALFNKEVLGGWLKGLGKFFVASFLVIGALGALFASDFNRYFTLFHKMFFHNDLWLLNPKTDILINMVPEIFFFQTVMLIIALFIVGIFIVLLMARWALKSMIKQG